MPLKTEEVEEPILNLTPMIDIVLLLIIFFMVGTKFSDAERQFEIILPTVADVLPLSSTPDALVVSIARNGEMLLGEQSVDRQTLEERLREAVERYEDQAVVIRGDGQGIYQNVVDVLAICHRAGARNLALPHRILREDEP